MDTQINIKYDDSIDRVIKNKAKSLTKKYTKQRVINEEKYLKPKSLFQKIFNVILTVFNAILILFSCILCECVIVGKINHIAPTFAGFSFLEVSSGSMTAPTLEYEGKSYPSGFAVGQRIVVKSVDTHTLNVGDKIAFYDYNFVNNQVYRHDCTLIDQPEVETADKISLKLWFGFQTDAINNAAKNNSRLIIHHVIRIYEDETGKRWFQTRGSANGYDDPWYISEDMIVGKYTEGNIAKIFAPILQLLSHKEGLLIVALLPLVLIVLLIIHEASQDVLIAKLELDCIEEKRKITDPICVKFNVASQMDKKTKYKILAQATEEDKNEYISLLWKNGSAPANIRKYVIRKQLLLNQITKLLELNRECSEKIKSGENPNIVATYYLKEKTKIDNEQINLQKRLKHLKKQIKIKG